MLLGGDGGTQDLGLLLDEREGMHRLRTPLADVFQEGDELVPLVLPDSLHVPESDGPHGRAVEFMDGAGDGVERPFGSRRRQFGSPYPQFVGDAMKFLPA